jgi:hydrogenase expression/formation protein HypC
MCVCIPGRIVAITDREHHLALVDVGGARRQANIACIVDDEHTVDACIGEWVLIHVGFALARIDEAEAARTLQLMDEIRAELEGRA